jgi:hypothetical protein
MAMNDSAQPKQKRQRRSTYAKRVEIRLTEAQLDLAEQARAGASATAGRDVTLSDILRTVLVDGGKAIAAAASKAPTRSSADGDRIAETLDGFAEEQRLLRTEIRRIGHNVNALTKIAHQTGAAVDDLGEVKKQLAVLDERLVDIARAAQEHTSWEG